MKTGYSFGTPNGDGTGKNSFGPFFSYSISNDYNVMMTVLSGVIVPEARRNDATFTYAIATKADTNVPEPGTLSLVGAALLGFGVLRLRRRAA